MRRWSDVKYARTGDGLHLAYQEAGEGSALLLLVDGFIPIESMDDEPRLAAAMERLAGFGHVIRFDRRGIGLSDRAPDGSRPTLEQWLDDAEAVLDAAECDEAVVVGDRGGALIAIGLAALRPRRVRSMILVNGFAKFMASVDHPIGVDPQFMAETRERLFDPQHPDGPFDIIGYLAPSAADDVRFRAWWDRAGRHGASPATARALRAAIEDLDVRDLLPQVEVPTLVIHRTDAAAPRVEQGRLLAQRIPGASIVELPGADSVWYVGEVEEMLDQMERFVTGGRPEGIREQVATVLFADIVDSTARAAAIGDQSWGRLFDAYEAAAHREVTRCNGVYIKSTGDGSLAIFDAPVSAADASQGIRRAAERLGLAVRIGLHTGPVERWGRDVTGLAVNVAARIMSFAREGETLMSAPTAESLRGSSFQAVERGAFEFKGVPGVWDVHAIDDG